MARLITILIIVSSAITFGCRRARVSNQNISQVGAVPTIEPTPEPTPTIPNLQVELLDQSNTSSSSPIAKFDFRNYTYKLPRGWQNPDGTTEITLKDGRIDPLEEPTNSKSIEKKNHNNKEKDTNSAGLRRIGMSLVTTKFFDVTGDGEDEAIVILKIETGGSAIPQIVHIFRWQDGRPELIWPFRTGDRADGGLKNIYVEGGNLVVELYGKDRFLVGQTETARIADDLEQLCCPTHFTRSAYKWNGRGFIMQGKRLTFAIADPTAAPLENMGDKVNKTKK